MNESLRGNIDITGVDLREFVKQCYAMSRPQGMGFLQPHTDALKDEEVDRFIERANYSISLDYVNGRAVKMSIWKYAKEAPGEFGWYIKPRWYDHSESQLIELLAHFNLDGPALIAKANEEYAAQEAALNEKAALELPVMLKAIQAANGLGYGEFGDSDTRSRAQSLAEEQGLMTFDADDWKFRLTDDGEAFLKSIPSA